LIIKALIKNTKIKEELFNQNYIFYIFMNALPVNF